MDGVFLACIISFCSGFAELITTQELGDVENNARSRIFCVSDVACGIGGDGDSMCGGKYVAKYGGLA